MWLNNVTQGKVKDPTTGKWAVNLDNIGLWAFEGITSMCDEFMQALAKKAGEGTNVGGGSNIAFKVSENGESLNISGNNMSHYNVVQQRIMEEIWRSQKLPGWTAWTAAVKRDEDPNAAGKILGPAASGKALTGELPRNFTYCFRISAVPGAGANPEKHILFLGDHTEQGCKGLGNTRVPLDAPKLPATIEPASLVKAIQLIQGSYKPAVEAIKKRLGI